MIKKQGERGGRLGEGGRSFLGRSEGTRRGEKWGAVEGKGLSKKEVDSRGVVEAMGAENKTRALA